ncbi:hypothetical protein ACSHWG_05335 [Leucobacter sp. Z1108]|uniref:hypothetical protein n=1 Tax=unclassified Leucobacter TaxID=2621730 RepID=UPI003D953B3F
MNRALKVTRLQMNKPDITFIVPASILLIVLVISAIIALAIQRSGVDPSTPGYVDGARSNQAMFWALPGFLIYLGVQAVSTTFPFALALGTTRRAFVAGTALAHLVQAAYISLLMVALLGLELATNHWFFGLYVLDTYVVGAGNPWQLLASAFIGTFVSLSIGGIFGAVWVRFGAKGPTVLGLVLGLAAALLLLFFAPRLGEIFAAMTLPMVAVGAIGVALLALAGTWLCMRRTAVR